MFYGRAAGHDSLFSLDLEYNEDDEWNSLQARGGVRPFLEAEDPPVVVFTVPSAEKGALLEAGRAFPYRAIIPSP